MFNPQFCLAVWHETWQWGFSAHLWVGGVPLFLNSPHHGAERPETAHSVLHLSRHTHCDLWCLWYVKSLMLGSRCGSVTRALYCDGRLEISHAEEKYTGQNESESLSKDRMTLNIQDYTIIVLKHMGTPYIELRIKLGTSEMSDAYALCTPLHYTSMPNTWCFLYDYQIFYIS